MFKLVTSWCLQILQSFHQLATCSTMSRYGQMRINLMFGYFSFSKKIIFFQPMRHLTPDGKSFINHTEMCQFSVGKRACLGEALARVEMLIIYANIFKEFNITKCDNVEYSIDNVNNMTTVAPQGYCVDVECMQ
jgi:hypothetical protein